MGALISFLLKIDEEFIEQSYARYTLHNLIILSCAMVKPYCTLRIFSSKSQDPQDGFKPVNPAYAAINQGLDLMLFAIKFLTLFIDTTT